MGLLGQVLGAANEIKSAAGEQVAPMVSDYDAEVAKTNAAKAEQAAALQDKIKQEEAAMAAPVPIRPQVPTYKPLPEAPVAPKSDPIQTMVQMLPILAALGAAKTSSAATMALNAGAAALHAMDANDKEALDKAHQTWMDNVKITLEDNGNLQRQYQETLNDRALSWKDREAKLTEIASAANDRIGLAALKAGNPEAIINRAKMLESAAEPIRQMYDHAQATESHQAAVAEDQRHNLATEAIALFKANKPPTPSMNVEAAKIAEKLAAGTALSEGEKQVWKAYDKWRSTGGGMMFPGAPAPAPAPDEDGEPGEVAPAPAAAAPSVADAGTLTTRATQAKAALARGANRDAVKMAWVQAGLPAAEFDKRVK